MWVAWIWMSNSWKIGERPSFLEDPPAVNERQHAFSGFIRYLASALTVKRKVVSNDLNADNKRGPGANHPRQSGREIHLPAQYRPVSNDDAGAGCLHRRRTFRANRSAYGDFFFFFFSTHFKREEDITMESGKLDEELKRTSQIVDRLTLNSMVLFNESLRPQMKGKVPNCPSDNHGACRKRHQSVLRYPQ